MGEVYRAEDLSLHRHVAIKVLPPRLAGRPDALERFEREAAAVGALNHPNIVTIHSIEEIDNQRLITMELVEGETLHSLVPEEGLAVERCIDLAIPLTAAVAAAHQRGVTHRDIKPANILLDPHQADADLPFAPKLTDFGLAKRDVGDGLATPDGEVIGPPAYISPELARGDAP